MPRLVHTLCKAHGYYTAHASFNHGTVRRRCTRGGQCWSGRGGHQSTTQVGWEPLITPAHCPHHHHHHHYALTDTTLIIERPLRDPLQIHSMQGGVGRRELGKGVSHVDATADPPPSRHLSGHTRSILCQIKCALMWLAVRTSVANRVRCGLLNSVPAPTDGVPHTTKTLESPFHIPNWHLRILTRTLSHSLNLTLTLDSSGGWRNCMRRLRTLSLERIGPHSFSLSARLGVFGRGWVRGEG